MLKEWLSKWFKPDHCFDHIWDIPVELFAPDMKALLLDFDGTLALKGKGIEDQRVFEWINAVRVRFPNVEIVLVSNLVIKSTKLLNRLMAAAEKIGASYYAAYWPILKPFPGPYRKSLRRVYCLPVNAAMVGDQVLTDIWGAKIVHILKTFLVNPLGRDNIITTLKRPIEYFLRWYLNF